MSRFSFATAGLLGAFCFGSAPAAQAQLTFFNNRATFNSTFNNLVTEDFEEGRGNSIRLPSPLDFTSNNNVFLPGEIVQGLRVTTAREDSTSLAFFTSGGGVNSKLVISNNSFPLNTVFLDGTTAVGMDLLPYGTISALFTINIFGTGDVLLGTTTVDVPIGGRFFGVSSASSLITRINLNSEFGFEGIDNVSFVTAAPEPGTMALAAMGLMGTAGMVIRRRKA